LFSCDGMDGKPIKEISAIGTMTITNRKPYDFDEEEARRGQAKAGETEGEREREIVNYISQDI